jgi:hypothetical protein
LRRRDLGSFRGFSGWGGRLGGVSRVDRGCCMVLHLGRCCEARRRRYRDENTGLV